MARIEGGFEDAAFNQAPPFENVDLFTGDHALGAALSRAGVDAARENLAAFGRDYGSAETMELGRLANEFSPRLRLVDGRGERRDIVEFHPAYHALMSKSVAAGLHSSAWSGGAAPIAARCARLYIATQVEAGHMCPTTMTNAAVAALAAAPALHAAWLPHILARRYDPAFKPWWEKAAVTLGMGMTERQGGTDVRANVSVAHAAGDHYAISGHKWFLSAPMCDAFLILAQAPGGLTCFLLPRFRPDGSVNALRLQRLKDKLGNRSNASSEVEFDAAFAERVGAEGAGIRTILDMVQWTRLDCAVASAGQMRMGLAQATHHARHRSVFQRRLIDQPAMRAVLADLALESEAATALVFRLARAFDRAAGDPTDAAYGRLMTPAVKYHVCKTAPGFVYETLECLGGNGYVEDLPMARLYREAPLNAIWEGSGNVMALDILRAVQRAPDAAAALVEELAAALPLRVVQTVADELKRLLAAPDAQHAARRIADTLARLAATAALAEADEAAAEAYAATRLAGAPHGWGASDLGAMEARLVARILQD